MPDNELAGRVALVTGAARNIGRKIALQLADGGAAVAVGARQDRAAADAVVAEIRARGGDAIALLGDVGREADADAIVAATVAHFGRLDILVNNAALRNERLLADLTLADWHAVLGVTLDGAFLCSRAAVPHLRQSDAASIINIGGIAAHAGVGTRSHVAAAKGGLVGFSRALAKELGPDGITVNVVAPGHIDTVRRTPPPAPNAAQADPHRYPSLTPHAGKPYDVAALVRHLAGPGGRYITGQTLHVNGGAYLGG